MKRILKIGVISFRNEKFVESLGVGYSLHPIIKARNIIKPFFQKAGPVALKHTDVGFLAKRFFKIPQHPTYVQCDAIRWEQLENLHFSRGYNF